MNIDKHLIKKAIEQAEKETSAEIMVFIEKQSDTPPLDRAVELFAEKGMHKTALRNGVLIYIDEEDRKLAVIGDVGFNSLVHPEYWETIKSGIVQRFKVGEFTQGLIDAIHVIGMDLKKHFPRSVNDINELPDDVVEIP